MSLTSHFRGVELALIGLYLATTYAIALLARRHLDRLPEPGGTLDVPTGVAGHYLAKRSMSAVEVFFFTIATELSATGFLAIPAFVYVESFSYVRFVVGAVASRAVLALVVLPRLTGGDTTVFEAFGRGAHRYDEIHPSGRRAQMTFGVVYLLTKLVGVAVNLIAASTVLASLIELPVLPTVLGVAALTYGYVVIGGLKAVTWTNFLQVPLFLIGALAAHMAVASLTSAPWGTLVLEGLAAQDWSPLGTRPGLASFLFGVLAGFVHDASSHGVDPEHSQILLAARSRSAARRGLLASMAGTTGVQLVFLTLGLLIAAYARREGGVFGEPHAIFADLIRTGFSPMARLLTVLGVLAAAMSSLDAAINAMGCVLWNDVLGKGRKLVRLYIHLDNLVITLCVVVVATALLPHPRAVEVGVLVAYLSTIPLFVFFVCRLLLVEHIPVSFSSSAILLTALTTAVSMHLAQSHLELDEAAALLFGFLTSTLAMWLVARIRALVPQDAEP